MLARSFLLQGDSGPPPLGLSAVTIILHCRQKELGSFKKFYPQPFCPTNKLPNCEYSFCVGMKAWWDLQEGLGGPQHIKGLPCTPLSHSGLVLKRKFGKRSESYPLLRGHEGVVTLRVKFI